jgi:predicted nucleic acid-binding protein
MNAAAERFFVDTNVLLYAVDPAGGGKRELAQQWADALWTSGAGRISWQVLNEFYANAVRKLRVPVQGVRTTVETLAQWQPIGFGLGVVQRAWYWADKAGVPYWDSLIVASAETAGCAYLLSEDFQTGRKFGDVTVVNPFRSGPEEFGLS